MYANSRGRGFTLLELLVTIMIIALLAGLLLPALSRARHNAWVGRTGSDLEQLITAWDTYLTDRQRWPDMDITEMDHATIEILIGSNEVHNPQSFPYMEFRTEEQQAGWRDHWGSIYQISIDNGRGRDSGSANDHSVLGPSGQMDHRIVVWSRGKDKIDGTKDDVVRY